MNPLRTLFLMLSRTPPALMLLAIIGLAVLITFTVTTTNDGEKAALEARLKEAQEKAGAKTKVVFVTRDIMEGAVIEADALTEKDMEVGRVPMDALPVASNAIGRRAKFPVAAGQILSSHDLAPIGLSLDFNSRLPEGMRAVTFAVDANSGVAGFVSPQSHVDVLSMVGSGQETKVAPILSDVEVVAVGQQFEREAKGQVTPASSVTVAVSPEDTNKLIKAVAASKLYLSLRNDKDHMPVTTVDVTALFAAPKRMAQDPLGVPVTALEPPPLPNPLQMENLPIPSGAVNTSASASVPMPPPLHEIEVWSGSRKDVIQVTQK